MKKGWETKRLGDFAATVSTGPFGSVLHKSDYVDEGVPLVNPTNMVDEGIIPDPSKLIDDVTKRRLSGYVLKVGDIVVARRGEIGRCAVIGLDEDGWVCGTGSFFIRPLPILDSQFLAHLIRSNGYREKLEQLSTGTTMKNLSNTALSDLAISVPPLPEQHRIVSLLDEAFAGLAIAQANAEKNLQNARALFESHLQSVFTQRGKGWVDTKAGKSGQKERQRPVDDAEMARLHVGYVTRTGGREATTRHIPGPLSLSVGMPNASPEIGWRWSALTDVARLESGHTPSRRHPEYWGGPIPWIGIQDARIHHGRQIENTAQTINELGTANSSARVLPSNTVCLSRTASVGYVVVMGRPMATSQDFVNWVCSNNLVPDFLKYVFLAEGRDGLLRYASGSVHQTIYFPEAKAFHICHPSPDEQRRIVKQCDALATETQRLARHYQQKLSALAALKKSLLHQAFTGAL